MNNRKTRRHQKSPSLSLPLPFNKAVEGLLATKPADKDKSAGKKPARKRKSKGRK